MMRRRSTTFRTEQSGLLARASSLSMQSALSMLLMKRVLVKHVLVKHVLVQSKQSFVHAVQSVQAVQVLRLTSR